MAIGVSTAQRLTGAKTHSTRSIVAEAEATPPPEVATPAPAVHPVSTPVETTRPGSTTPTPAILIERPAVVIGPEAPELGERLKPLLNRGANMTIAAEGFGDAEQFAAVAHAARNTGVPFMLLKHRVVGEGKSLADAIRELQPGTNATVEAERAIAEARSDLAALAF
jgi:hypothetical protein